ncbi:MAG: hypothetical protein ACXV7D_14835, partial [Thermoanaerobaculia bacterium]
MALEGAGLTSMTRQRRLQWVLAAVVAAGFLLLLPWVMRRLSIVSIGLAANEESQAVLQTNLTDLKALSRLDPAHAAIYRRHFEETQALLQHLQILALSRHELTRRAEAATFGLFGAIAACGAAIHMTEQRRRARRLARLNEALESLSRGDGIVSVGDDGRDMIGTFASMIEETSRVVVKDRRRMHYL